MPKVLINKNFVLRRYIIEWRKFIIVRAAWKQKFFLLDIIIILITILLPSTTQQTIYQCVCTLYYTMDICLHDKFRHIEKKVGLVTASHLIYGERVDGKTLNAIISTFSKGVVPPQAPSFFDSKYLKHLFRQLGHPWCELENLHRFDNEGGSYGRSDLHYGFFLDQKCVMIMAIS